MSNKVVIVDAVNRDNVMSALRSALFDQGPAVLIRDSRAGKLLREASGEIQEVPEDTALLIQTSGTSGLPKTVALSARALIAAAHSAHQRLGGEGQWLLALPLTYIAGASVLIRSLVAGTEPIALEPGPFNPEEFVVGVSHMSSPRKYSALVPIQLARVLEHVEKDPAALALVQQLDAILIGGQSVPESLKNKAKQLGVNIIRTYGSSETAGGCVYDGIRLEGVVLEVDPQTDELFVSAPQLATGYAGDYERTAEIFQNRNGKTFFATGDLATLEEGKLSIIGRQDRTIISGGLKVNLDQVEKTIRLQISHSELVVIHIPNLEWGSAPAVVMLHVPGKSDEEVTEQILDLVTEKLGRAATPAVVAFVDKLPQLSSGKPDLLACKEIARAKKLG